MSLSRGRTSLVWATLVAVAASGVGRATHAYEAATTQAGLIQRAAQASRLHAILVARFGRPLGLFEPLGARPGTACLAHTLADRLALFDPAEGYRPPEDGVQSALAWLAAGAALSETPAEQGRHHYYDPTTGQGLDDRVGLSGIWQAIQASLDAGGGLRRLATGTAFNQTGQPSVLWWHARENPLSYERLEDALFRAISGALPAEREAALIDALLALGGVAAVLMDAGEPAHVRNDFRAAATTLSVVGAWDARSGYEHFVAERYGRQGLPAPLPAVRRPTLDGFITHPDGEGLADRTQRRFFSEGSVPAAVPVTALTSAREVRLRANQSLRYPAPVVGRLDLQGVAEVRYLKIEGRRALAYRRYPDRVQFFIDQNVWADSAQALLPEVGGYVAGLIEHVLRGELRFVPRDFGALALAVDGVRGPLLQGTLLLYWEDEDGRRRPLGAPMSVASAEALGQIAVTVPAAARRVAGALRAQDGAGSFLAVGEARVGEGASRVAAEGASPVPR